MAEWPCGVYGKGVGRNSILCTQCGKWIHKRCEWSEEGSLESCKNFKCGKCSKCELPVTRCQIARQRGTTVGLEFVDTFCPTLVIC